jgi:alanine racemase
MVMGWMDDDDLGWVIENQIEFFVFDIAQDWRKLIPAVMAKPALIHIEMETGMNRTGMTMKELKIAVEFSLKTLIILCLKGLCTHLAGAESIANHVRIQNQLATVLKALWLVWRSRTGS